MSFSDYNCSLMVEPVSLLFLFCSSIASKRRQLGGRRGKQLPLLPHEKELLAGVGEDEITQLLAHQDHIQAQCRRRQRAEEQESSTSSTCTAEAEQEVEETCPVEAAGDAEEQPDVVDPGSEVFILNFTRWTKAWTCPRLVGLIALPPQWFLQVVFSSTLHHYPPGHTHWCLLPSASFSVRSRTSTHPPPSRATCG
ncbi:hypothetical protein AB205_0140290 [Aquarana catesbeiana]|uniref:Uncharacterized protein n=1 Tax=Aquarana catesbeiana TaxID=8400 RepID=A0A2G9R5P9_AQUCT|nr:hypothetical protein AB205_0140290 [Aquarana catesbeiana]